MATGSNVLTATGAAPRVLYSGQLANTTEDTIYTTPAGSSCILKQGTICNTSGSAVTINISILQSGQTVGTGQHRVISVYSLAGGDTLSLADYIDGSCLGPGDFVTAKAGTANVLDIILSGVENT